MFLILVPLQKKLWKGFTEISRNFGVYDLPVNSFKWKHYEGEIILLNVRWYLKYALSYRNLKEMMAERGVKVDHTTIMRWVHQYSPEMEKRTRRHLRPTNDSWKVDETYIRVKGEWDTFTKQLTLMETQLISCKVLNEIEKLQRDSLRKLWGQSTTKCQEQ